MDTGRRAGRNRLESANDLIERDSGMGMGMMFCLQQRGTRRTSTQS